MEGIEFIDQLETHADEDELVVVLCNISDAESLFKSISSQLKFPNYFGYNWDALYDCLCDLSWLEERKVFLIHRDLPSLDAKSLKIYVQILIDVYRVWEKNVEHSFKVAFPLEHKKLIGDLFGKV